MMQNFETLKDAKRSLSPSEFKRIHQLALQAAADFKKSEVDLITALQFVSNSKVYRRLGFNSLYQYAIQSLGLSESQANDYTTVARKSLDFPKLKEAIESRELTISKVRRLCSVINEKNQLTWLELGKNISKKDLEKEIAKVNPRAVNPEQTRFLTDTVLELKLPISDKAHKTLEQVRDLLQQKHQRPLSLEEVISEISEFYIQKNDPIEKANRAAKRNSKKAEVVGQEIIGLGQKPLRHVRQNQGLLVALSTAL